MNRKANVGLSTRETILTILKQERSLSLDEIANRVKERKPVKLKSIQRHISNLLRMGIIVCEGEDRKYKVLKKSPEETRSLELGKKENRELTPSETGALRSVMNGIAPFLIDADEKMELYELLGRIHDLDKLVASQNVSDGYLTLARLCLDFYKRYTDTFELENDSRSSNPLRARVSVKDPLALLLVRFKYDDTEINQLQYFRNKQDYQTQVAIESARQQNMIIEEIDKALKDTPDLRYVARILALKRASPRWIFGYEFEKDVRKINDLLSKSNLKFDIENGDRLVLRMNITGMRRDLKSVEFMQDLNLLTEELEKFFHHPSYAIMPNPFNKKPSFWKYFEGSFSGAYHSWVSSFKVRITESKKNITYEDLLNLWIEFCTIVGHYRSFALSFREIASTKEQEANIPEHIKKQHNTKFVEEFNVLLRKIQEFAVEFEQASGLKVPNKQIEPAKPITSNYAESAGDRP